MTAAGAAAAAAALAASAEGAGPAPSGPCYRSALQQLLIDVFTDDDPGQRLLLLSAMVPAAHQAAWHLVVHTLWARRLDLGSPTHARQAADAHTRAWMLSRQWDQPVLQQRWQRLIGGMGESLCRRLVSRARRQWRSAMALH